MDLKNKNSFIIGIIFIFATSLIALSWFKEDLVYSFGDFTLNFSPKNNIEQFLYIWNEKISAGSANFQNFPNLFPYQTFLYVWDCLNLPLFIGQRLMFWGLFLLSGLSMYKLILVITEGEKRHLWATFSALFYMMNPFSLVVIWGVLGKSVFFYALLPLLLAYYIKLLDGKGISYRHIFLFIFVSFLATTSFSVLTFAADLWLVVLCYLLYRLFFISVSKQDRFKAITVTILLFAAWTAVNSYWLVPYVNRAVYLTETAKNIIDTDPAALLRGASRTAQLTNTIRLFGYNVFNEKFMGIDLYYPYSEKYSTPFFIALSFAISVYIFTSLFTLFRNKITREKYCLVFFSLLSLFSLFFYKGVNQPFSVIYSWLADKSSLFALAFRNPIDKIGILTTLGYSVLFGYSTYWFSTVSGKISKVVVPVLVIMAVFGIYLFPFWQGKVFYQGGKTYRSSMVKVPDYYWKAATWLGEQKDNFRLFPVPLTGMYGLPLNWEYGYDAANPLTTIFNKPVYFTEEGESPQKEIWWLFNSDEVINKEVQVYLKSLLALSRIRYIVIHNDIAQDYFSINITAYDTVKTRVKDNLKLAKTFDKLSFYEIDNPVILPSIILSEEKVSSTSALLGDYVKPDFKRINPTKWEINITEWEIDKPIYLTFLEKFDQNWKVYLLPEKKVMNSLINNIAETWSYTAINEAYHQEVFGYANLWQINTHQYYGPFRIIIEYTPQKLFYIGSLIALTCCCGLGGVSIVWFLNNKRK